MSVVTSVKLRVLWKGDKGEFLKPKKGLRQGDPMSLYLLVLCMDKLSHLIHDAVDSHSWHCLKIGNKDPRVSHLMFSNNLIHFGVTTESQIQVVMNILTTFCDAYGEKINMDKSSILLFGNTPLSTRRLLIAKSCLK